MNDYAIYDTLSLSLKLQERLDDVSISEIQMFAYLACILSIYDGKGANEWGYLFIKNELGAPYSNDIINSISSLGSSSVLLMKDHEYFIGAESAEKKFENFKKMNRYKLREVYLSAASKCIKFVPYGDVREALFEEPTLLYSRKLKDRQVLLDDTSATISLLHKQFENLRMALDRQYKNLTIPALVWMSHNSNRQFG